ncbi:hypothetical protein SLEP1_g18673 [Rubroshorea leprosula]|uniref:Uncharacterized protein n=1 Tax=Rubroshorea leprosula TaxID=152421 RepID=A0AAV5IY99_9ROSI|nr:hypothetical protein SLEP1_g18673 [Rubroshorea leprosula]
MEDEHEATDHLSIWIDHEKLSSFSTVSSSGCSIFRVPNLLRQTNEKAYEPHIISIGPYHHGKDHLKGMEVHKMHYLKRLLQRRGETSAHRYLMALKDEEKKIRECYAEPLNPKFDGDALAKMMILDGCFIIELIRENQTETQKIDVDFRNFNRFSLKRDLLLVENQLPFFVLTKLFQMTGGPNQENVQGFIPLALLFFSRVMPGYGNGLVIRDQNIKNLLGLVLDSWVPSLKARDNYRKISKEYGGWNFKYSATELHEAGIKFKKIDHEKIVIKPEIDEAGNEVIKMGNEKSFFDIKFENDVLWIPTIKMYAYTDSILRNFIVHEQCHNNDTRYVTDYVTFMDCLINTSKDVELLRHSGIIVNNGLGDDEVVATVFNKLCDSIVFSKKSFYSEIFIKVKGYREKKWNLWMANLKHNYFNTPWALISVLAAVSLLILAAVQTIYSHLSYYKR